MAAFCPRASTVPPVPGTHSYAYTSPPPFRFTVAPDATLMVGALSDTVRVGVPVIGLIKCAYEGYAPYITPTLDEVRAVIESGAEIVAFDATGRARPRGASIAQIVDAILAEGRIPMADCATAEDAVCARAAGAEILATTLCGYTEETKGISLPALAMVRELAELDAFTICEGGVASPQDCLAAREAGADAVVVGTALTGIESRVRDFTGPLEKVDSPKD